MASGNSGGKSSGGSDNILLSQQAGEVHPRGILAALGYIEISYANERGGCIIDPSFLTSPQRVEFMEVGIRSSLGASTVMALLSPVAIGILGGYIPIFDSFQPTLADQICGILLALAFPLCYSLLFVGAALNHLGGYSRAMVNNLLGGMAMIFSVKAIIVFLLFHLIYFKVLTDDNISWAIQKLYAFRLSYQSALKLFVWIKDFKHVFITSSYFVLISTVVVVAIPYIAYFWARQRNTKMIEAGVVNVFQENR